MEIIYEFLIQPWQEKLSSYFTHHLWTGTLKIKYVKQGGSCPTFPMGKTQGIQSFEIYSNTFESSSFPLAIKCLHKESTHKRWREEKMLHILCCAYFLCDIMLTLFYSVPTYFYLPFKQISADFCLQKWKVIHDRTMTQKIIVFWS